jgi:hypothetical protein
MVCGWKREEVSGVGSKQHNEGLHDLYSTLNVTVIRIMDGDVVWSRYHA